MEAVNLISNSGLPKQNQEILLNVLSELRATCRDLAIRNEQLKQANRELMVRNQQLQVAP